MSSPVTPRSATNRWARPRSASWQALCTAALLGLFSACGNSNPPSTKATTPHVLLVCLDTLRADHMGAYGYELRPTTPTLDALAASGVLFTDTTATAAWTKPSVPSFLTGSWPAVHGVYEGSARRGGMLTTDVLSEGSYTLAEAFADQGYDTAAFLRNAQLRPGRGFEQGFDLYVDQAGDAAEICAAALAWLDERQDGRPFFLYLHILDAHWPYDIPDEAAARFADPEIVELISGDNWRERRDAINDGELLLDEVQHDQMLALYDGAIAYADAQLGLLFEALRDRGLYDDLVVAVVADHGEEFLEHGRLGHGHGLFENLTQVGWIMDGPGIAPSEVSTPVSLIDLFPTVLSAAGLDGAVDPGTKSLLRGVDRLSQPDRLTPIFSEHKAPNGYWQSLRAGDYKLVRHFVPPVTANLGASPAAGLLLGDRWEVELAEGWAHGLVAAQVKPRDESKDDPLEIKGVLEGQGGGQLQLAGLTVTLSPATRWSGTLSGAEDLHVGSGLKVKVTPSADGLTVLAVKGYDSADVDTELRGPVSRVQDDADDHDHDHDHDHGEGEGDGAGDGAGTGGGDGAGAGDGAGTFWIGGLPVTFNPSTVWKHMPSANKEALLEREDVARLLNLGADGAQAEGFTVTVELFDLQADPGEQAALAHLSPDEQEQVMALGRLLDRLGRSLVADRLWSDSDGVELGEDDLAALRALGYVK